MESEDNAEMILAGAFRIGAISRILIRR